MTPEKLEIMTRLQIRKPVHEVFDASAAPGKMKNYFIEKGSGRMEEGKELIWKFPEFEEDIPLRVGKVEKNKYLTYNWEDEGQDLFVEILLDPATNGDTIVTVREGTLDNDEAGLRWLKSHTEGWANFLACMKAYLEYGINLRNGAFDFMREK